MGAPAGQVVEPPAAPPQADQAGASGACISEVLKLRLKNSMSVA